MIDWSRLPEAVDGLRLQIEELYRSGITSTKVRYWIAAHDLVARYVKPTIASQWVPERRDGRDEADPRAWLSSVDPDEFPLSIFYQSLPGEAHPCHHRGGGGVTAPLTGRRVLVTGAAGGLGPTVVAAAADAGAHVVLVDLAQDRLDELATAHAPAVVETAVVDLLDPAAVSAFANTIEPVDIVWHLVGGWRGGQPLAQAPLADWEWLHGLLARTTVHLARSFADQLTASRYGRFAIVSAKQAQAPTSTNAAYAASKAAAEATVLALADGFKGSSATANIVVVPAIVTPAMREASPDKEWGAFVPAEQIAGSLVYLSSDAAAKMNGQRLRLYTGSPS